MEIKANNLIGGYKMPLVTGAVEVEAGTYERGMILGDVSGVGKLIGETGVDINSLNCIVIEDKTLTEKSKIEVYLTGEFNKNEIKFKEPATIESIISVARKLGIFIK